MTVARPVRPRRVRDRFKAGDRTTAIDNQDRRASLETIDEGTEAVLGFGNTSFFHCKLE